MKRLQTLAISLLVAALLQAWGGVMVFAQSASVSGSGRVRINTAPADFNVQLDEAGGVSFSHVDYSTDPPVSFWLEPAATTACLGNMFGGQTVQVIGQGADSALPNEVLKFQLYLVDGGGGGPDRYSLKVSRANDAVVYFVPMRQLEGGDIAVTCLG